MERAPEAQFDGMPHLLGVVCTWKVCSYAYDGVPAIDSDGSGFDLRITARAGRAYAFSVGLPARESGVDVQITIYDPAASGGPSSFPVIVRGSLGQWTPTAPGHVSYPEFHGCSNNDRACWGHSIGSRSFGIHPGGEFGSQLVGTWVSAVDRPVLVHLAMNCDVPFFADVQVSGCWIKASDDSFGCHASDADECTASLSLTMTEDAYFSAPEMQSTTSEQEYAARGAAMFAPTSGQATIQHVFEVDSDELEATALAIQQERAVRGTEMFGSEHTPLAPLTVNSMLVGGSEANALLASMFTSAADGTGRVS